MLTWELVWRVGRRAVPKPKIQHPSTILLRAVQVDKQCRGRDAAEREGGRQEWKVGREDVRSGTQAGPRRSGLRRTRGLRFQRGLERDRRGPWQHLQDLWQGGTGEDPKEFRGQVQGHCFHRLLGQGKSFHARSLVSIARQLTGLQEEAVAALDMNMTKLKSRILNVALSASKNTKRQATSIIKPRQSDSPSASSPQPDAAHAAVDDEATDAVMTDAPPNQTRPSKESLQARTVALMHVPDTVNDARIRALMEPYGTLTKIVLRPDHQGAIVEFAHTKDAGRAALGVEGKEIVPGRTLVVGSVRELLSQLAERKELDRPATGKRAAGGKTTSKSRGGGSTGAAAIHQPAPIKRPAQPGARRGGRGGLGIKRGGVGLSSSRATTRPQGVSPPATSSSTSISMTTSTTTSDTAPAVPDLSDAKRNPSSPAPSPPSTIPNGHVQTHAHPDADTEREATQRSSSYDNDRHLADAGPAKKTNADFKAMFLNK